MVRTVALTKSPLPADPVPTYDESVFINCPFDDDYLDIFRALVFTVHDCGFVARSAQEITDSGQVRIEKIVSLIRDCRLGIHDLSRTELDANGLPRFKHAPRAGHFLGRAIVGYY